MPPALIHHYQSFFLFQILAPFLAMCPFGLAVQFKWGVTKQRRSARSSAESEIVAMDEATKATQALRLVLEDLSLADTSNPTPVNVDNQATIKWSNNQSTKKLRHLNIRENAIRDVVAFDEIILLFVPGKLNLSDLFPKEF